MTISTIQTGDLLTRLPEKTREILYTTLMNNGCIAGGFARRLAGEYFGFNKVDLSDLTSQIYDIDVFHFDHDGRDKSLPRWTKPVKMLSDGSETQSSSSSFADNYEVDGIKIQFIHEVKKSIKDLLNSFDISNCCVAYADHKLFIKNLNEWKEMEIQKQLRTQPGMYGDKTSLRVVKYYLNYKYRNFDSYTKMEFLRNLSLVSPYSNVSALERIKKHLTNDDLLQISMMSVNRKNVAELELLTRSKHKQGFSSGQNGKIIVNHF